MDGLSASVPSSTMFSNSGFKSFGSVPPSLLYQHANRSANEHAYFDKHN